MTTKEQRRLKNRQYVLDHIKATGPVGTLQLQSWMIEQLPGINSPTDAVNFIHDCVTYSPLYRYCEDGRTYYTLAGQDPR